MASVHLENFKMREAQFILSSFCIIPLGLRKVGAHMAITTWFFQKGLEDFVFVCLRYPPDSRSFVETQSSSLQGVLGHSAITCKHS